jgi:hypothetical protein
MPKSRRRGAKLIKTLKRDAKSALPVVASGLKKVGVVTKNVAVASIPIAEKGVSAIYGTLAKGFDLGIKGAKNVAEGLSKRRRSRTSKRSRRRYRR